jgi:hypothetical protein
MLTPLLPVANDPEIILNLLEQTADKLKITIRYEPVLGAAPDNHSDGGLCKLHGKNIMIIDSNLSDNQKCSVICDILKTLDLSKIFIPPLIRQLLS